MAHPGSAFPLVHALVSEGFSDYSIAARTGIPRSTVKRWRRRESAPRTREPTEWSVSNAEGYCYLLGLYLGDGHVIHRPPNGWRLRLACDNAYPGIIDESLAAMATMFPPATPTCRSAASTACKILSISHPGIGAAFPQHGNGPKHTRPIVLAQWQRDLTDQHPRAFIRGQIQSDGCRVMNRFRTSLPSGRVANYEYPRCFFSNVSEDIRELFREHCVLLGIRVTQSNHRNLTVSHRDSVAILDTFVGPKA